MEQEYVLQYHEYKFIFVFTIGEKRSMKNEDKSEDNFPFIKCKLYRIDYPHHHWAWPDDQSTWLGLLKPSPAIEFGLKFYDNVDIQGNFYLFQSEENGDWVWLDVRYGKNYEEHFEGSIINISSNNPLQPILPD